MAKEKFVRDKPHLSIGVLITLFAIATASFTGLTVYQGVLLADEDRDGISDREEAYYARTLTLNQQPGKIQLISTLTSDVTDQISIEIEYASTFQIKSYYQSNLTLLLEFVRIFEFDDSNSNFEFDPATDVVLHEIFLNDLSPLIISSDIGGQPGYNITLESSSGFFTAKSYMSPEFLPFGASILTPWMNKWDFHIMLPSIPGPNSLIAIEILINSSSSLAWTPETFDEVAGYVQNETGLAADTEDLRYYFSWHNTALVDGINQPVVGDLENNDTLYLLFSRGLQIDYDPIIVPKLDDRNYHDLVAETHWTPLLILSAASLVTTVLYPALKGKKILQN